MADKLAVNAKAYGKGWGAKVAASFAINKQSSMNTNEVIVKASHSIELGKMQINPSSLKLTKIARTTLATTK